MTRKWRLPPHYVFFLMTWTPKIYQQNHVNKIRFQPTPPRGPPLPHTLGQCSNPWCGAENPLVPNPTTMASPRWTTMASPLVKPMFGCLVSEGAESFSSENGAAFFREAAGILWVSGWTDLLLGFLGLPARKSIAPLEFVSWRSTAMQRQRQQKAQGIRTLEA